MKGKKMARKLIVSIMILVAAVALAGTSTYAWFTMNANPYVGAYDVQITTESESLFVSLIGADGTPANLTTLSGYDQANADGIGQEFKAYLTAAEVQALITLKSAGKKLTHATLYKDSTHLYIEDGVVSPDRTTKDASPTTPQDAIFSADGSEMLSISYRIFFQAAKPMNVTLVAYDSALNQNGSRVTADDIPTSATPDPTTGIKGFAGWKATSPKIDYNWNQRDNVSNATTAFLPANAANAVRIAFGSMAATNGIAAATAPTEIVGIWNPNPDGGYDTDGFTVANHPAMDYYNAYNGTTYVPVDVDAAYANLSTSVVAGNTVIARVDNYDDDAEVYYGYVDVTMWIEGWDSEAFNAILASKITTQLKFAGTAITLIP